METTVVGKRRIQYEEELAHDNQNYDVWCDYARLEGGTSQQPERKVNLRRRSRLQSDMWPVSGYGRSVSQAPPSDLKRHMLLSAR